MAAPKDKKAAATEKTPLLDSPGAEASAPRSPAAAPLPAPTPDKDSDEWARPPTWRAGMPTVVKVANILVYKLQNIDTAKGTAEIEILMWLEWVDERLLGLPQNDLLPTKLWNPHPRLMEVKGLEMQRVTSELARFDAALKGRAPGQMHKLVNYQGVVFNQMENLMDFPFDRDTVHLTFRGSECRLGNNDETVNVNFKSDYRMLAMKIMAVSSTQMPDWKVMAIQHDYVETNGVQDVLRVSIHLSRHPDPHIWQIVVPLFMITALNLLGFTLPIDDVASHMAHNVTLFLAAVALLYVVGADLPKSKKQSAMDRLITFTLSLLLATTVHAVVEYEHYKHTQEVREVPYVLLASYSAIYAVNALVVFGPPYCRRRAQEKKWLDAAASDSGDSQDIPIIAGHAFEGGYVSEDKEGALTVEQHVEKIKAEPDSFGWPERLIQRRYENAAEEAGSS